MKHTALLAALAALLIANQSAKAQGALTPPGAPAESQKSLQEIYDAIQSVKAELTFLSEKIAPNPLGMVKVLGGTMPQGSELAGQKVETFYIGKYEVTLDEWQEVRTWAEANGYSDLANVGAGSAGNHPVHTVSWYDVLKWSNARSEKEGLAPVYSVNGTVYRTGQSEPTVNISAKGYRLPTEAEWEWAARGGVSSLAFTYSGSNDVNEVAWFFDNSTGALVTLWNERGSWPVGQKRANELAIHDMSGNVWEWCWSDGFHIFRPIRGGSWGDGEHTCAVSDRSRDDHAHEGWMSIGFRLARSFDTTQ